MEVFKKNMPALSELQIGLVLEADQRNLSPEIVAAYAETLMAPMNFTVPSKPGFHADPWFVTFLGMEVRKDLNEWLAERGIARHNVVHVAQHTEFHSPLPATGIAVTTGKIVRIKNGGEGRQVIISILFEIIVTEEEDADMVVATTINEIFLAGQGWGEQSDQIADGYKPYDGQISKIKDDHEASDSIQVQTSPEQALAFVDGYDGNPHCRSDEAAREAGLPFAPMPGLCFLGMLHWGALDALCGNVTERLLSMTARVTAPVRAGDLLILEYFDLGDGEALGRVRVLERDGLPYAGDKGTVALAKFSLKL
jgi:hypothetical protein